MAERKAVYSAIDSERKYQLSKWQDRSHQPEAFCLFMEEYLNKARTLASTTDFTEVPNLIAFLDAIRKVTALGVACMEQHGAPTRPGF